MNVPIFEVAGCDTALLFLARKMTLVNTAKRSALLAEATTPLNEMQRLVETTWPGDTVRASAVRGIEEQLTALAGVRSENDFLINWGAKRCTVCDRLIGAPKGMPHLACCAGCLAPFQEARKVLRDSFAPAEAEIFAD